MKSEKMVASCSKSLFVVFAALAIVIAYALPAFANVPLVSAESQVLIGGPVHLEKVPPLHLHKSALKIGPLVEAKKHKLIHVGISKAVLAALAGEVGNAGTGTHGSSDPTSTSSGGSDTQGSRDDTPTISREATPTHDSHDTTPTISRVTTTTQGSHETTEPATTHRISIETLPFTGGNATPFVIGGLLLAIAGAAVLIRKRRLFTN